MVTTENIDDKITHGTLPAAQYNRVLKSSNPTYMVYEASSIYYARKTTGDEVLLYSDPNFSDLMNFIILDLYGTTGTGIGGSIFIRTGVYYADATINMRAGIHIWGEGRCGNDTQTYLSTLIVLTTDTTLFHFDTPDNSARYHSGLHLLWLTGNVNLAGATTTSPIIDVNPTTNGLGDVFFDDLSIVLGRYGIRVRNNTANDVWNIFIQRCFIEKCDYNAILVEETSTGAIFQVKILNNHFWSNCHSGGNGDIEVSGADNRGGIIAHNTIEETEKHGIFFTNGVHHWIIESNVIHDVGAASAGNYDGIHLDDTTAGVTYCTITGNNIANINTVNTRYGVREEANSDWNLIVANVLRPVATAGVSQAGAANSVVANNVVT